MEGSESWFFLPIGFKQYILLSTIGMHVSSQTHALEHSCQADNVSKWHIQIINMIISLRHGLSASIRDLGGLTHSYTLGGDGWKLLVMNQRVNLLQTPKLPANDYGDFQASGIK